MALINEVKKKEVLMREEKEGPAGGSQKNNVNEPVAVSNSLHCSCVREKHSSALCGVLLSL